MLQVVSFNIGGARSMRPAPHDHEKLAVDAYSTLRQVITPSQPTLIALQESGVATLNGSDRNVGRKMAQLLGADYQDSFAPEVTMCDHPHPNLWDRPAYRDMTGAAEGNAIVTNLPMGNWSWGNYPAYDHCYNPGAWARHTTISRATLYSSGNRDTQPRNLMAASLNYRGIPFYFLNTHLGLLIGEDRRDDAYERSRAASQIRQAQVSEILYVIDELKRADQYNEMPERPILLAGDFNAQPASPEMEMLQRHFRLLRPENKRSELWTHNTHRILIDHILLHDPAEQFEVISCHIQSKIPFDDLTDHRPTVGIFALA
jgi:endonuclease/exonuclease/phosphatase family metal-dependent hydrolase